MLSEFLGGRQITLHVLGGAPSPHPALQEPAGEQWDEGPSLDGGWHELRVNALFSEPIGDGVLRVSLEVAGAGAIAARIERAASERFLDLE